MNNLEFRLGVGSWVSKFLLKIGVFNKVGVLKVRNFVLRGEFVYFFGSVEFLLFVFVGKGDFREGFFDEEK